MAGGMQLRPTYPVDLKRRGRPLKRDSLALGAHSRDSTATTELGWL